MSSPVSNPTDATTSPMHASPGDATLFSPALPAPRPSDTPGTGSPPRDRGHAPVRTAVKPSEPPTKPSSPPRDAQESTEPADTAAQAGKCTKADFAAVYEATAPASSVVHAALQSLKACHDA